MTYSEFIERITPYAGENFAAFQRKLIFTERTILGIRTPTMRKLVKELRLDIDELMGYSNEYYEVVFMKLIAVSALPYDRFCNYVEDCVSLMDNWALCDCFKATCIQGNREEFLPILERFFQTGREYFVRYVLVSLLFFYVEEPYLPLIKEYLKKTDTKEYYVHMATAWLTAEVLIKSYDVGVEILREGVLQTKTHNKAIQKAIESYRLTKNQKEFLRSLKIKTER